MLHFRLVLLPLILAGLVGCADTANQPGPSSREVVFQVCGATRSDAQVEQLILDVSAARAAGAERSGLLGLILEGIDLESEAANDQVNCTLALLDHIYSPF